MASNEAQGHLAMLSQFPSLSVAQSRSHPLLRGVQIYCSDGTTFNFQPLSREATPCYGAVT
jgi:hypothetical protein